MTVLVLAAETDRTADGVITALNELRVPVMRVDTSWFPQTMILDAEFQDGSCGGTLRTTYHEVDLASIRSVWVRTPSTYVFPDTMSAAERDYARREAKIGVCGALLALPDVLWVEPSRPRGYRGVPAVAVGNRGALRDGGPSIPRHQRSGGS